MREGERAEVRLRRVSMRFGVSGDCEEAGGGERGGQFNVAGIYRDLDADANELVTAGLVSARRFV